MLGRLVFRLHWMLGLAAGSVLAFMGITGASLSFKDEILRALNPGVVVLEGAGTTLPADTLLRCASESGRVTSLTIASDARLAVRAASGQSARYFHPSTCAELGVARGEQALRTLEDLHRKLAMGDAGKAITGACALALIVLLLSGLYQRWPRGGARGWRTWLTANVRLRGRPLWYSLHKTAGTWLLVLLLHSALTSLFFAYDWYKAGVFALAGLEAPKPRPKGGPSPVGPDAALPDLAIAWQSFVAQAQWTTATLKIPDEATKPLQITYLEPGATHDRASNRMEIDLASGAIKKHERYADKTRGGQLVASMYPLHTGSFYGVGGRIVFMASALSLPFFAASGWILHLHRRRAVGARTVAAEAVP